MGQSALGSCGHQAETQSHIHCLCPALEEARVRAHLKMAQRLWKGIRDATKGWTMVTEQTVEGLLGLLAHSQRTRWYNGSGSGMILKKGIWKVRARRSTLASVNDARRLLSGGRALGAPDGMPLHRLTCCSHLRSLLTAARERLAVKKERADYLAGEHFKLSQELRRALDQRRPQSDAREAASATLASDHAASLRRLEALHKIELERAKATAVAAREQDQLKLDRLVAKRPGLG
jgi:hypothetical protein